MKVCFNLYR